MTSISKHLLRLALLALLAGLVPGTARAEEGAMDLSAQRHLVELGLYAGIFIPPESHELYQLDVRHVPLETVAFDGGLRLGYLPFPFIGLELEGGVMPTKTRDDHSTLLYHFRGHVIGQYPARLAPFLVVGYGLEGVSSDLGAVGDDVDGAFHTGLGLKFYATRFFVARLDGRVNISGKVGDGGLNPYWEVLLGASWVFGWKDPPPADTDLDGVLDKDDACPTTAGVKPSGCPDQDGDGVLDKDDQCPSQAGIAPHGCPDRDGDGVLDSDDQCPDQAGVKPSGCPDQDGDGVLDKDDQCPADKGAAPSGCPDQDSDGVLDKDDACPTEAGIKPSGCPDKDGDGIVDKDDQCADKPETQNGFKDQDGCPDEVPKAVKKFQGTIEGIYFEVDKDTIRKKSFPKLDQAVKVLKEYADLNLLIRGHTDDTGAAEHNLDLSKRRAESVKNYMVSKGIDAGRLQTEGVGSNEPVDPAKTNKARAKNRRIEFKLISK